MTPKLFLEYLSEAYKVTLSYQHALQILHNDTGPYPEFERISNTSEIKITDPDARKKVDEDGILIYDNWFHNIDEITEPCAYRFYLFYGYLHPYLKPYLTQHYDKDELFWGRIYESGTELIEMIEDVQEAIKTIWLLVRDGHDLPDPSKEEPEGLKKKIVELEKQINEKGQFTIGVHKGLPTKKLTIGFDPVNFKVMVKVGKTIISNRKKTGSVLNTFNYREFGLLNDNILSNESQSDIGKFAQTLLANNMATTPTDKIKAHKDHKYKFEKHFKSIFPNAIGDFVKYDDDGFYISVFKIEPLYPNEEDSNMKSMPDLEDYSSDGSAQIVNTPRKFHRPKKYRNPDEATFQKSPRK